jgi:putative spermidine/putrescine transport system ATP-binding protein
VGAAPRAERQLMPTRGALGLREVTKLYAGVRAVDRVSLDTRPGEFVTLLGPSGSGKTTTLRIVAGIVRQDAGSVTLDGQDLSGQPPYRRDMGMVFQNYALFPHMTAAGNVAFPLEMRGIDGAEIRRRVGEALELVHLDGLGQRYPRQLSGGQQQRVALARAIVFRPRLLLMDEPLGALDKKLREALQLEIVRISRQVGTTVLYVTHDQEEALVMSDRIAIYNRGRIEQLGPGEELYERPVSLFVANFVGASNVFHGVLRGGPVDGVLILADGSHVRAAEAAWRRAGLAEGARAAIVVRPERVRLSADAVRGQDTEPVGGRLAGSVREAIYVGAARKYVVECAGGLRVLVQAPAGQPGGEVAVGTRVELSWPMSHGVVVPDTDVTPEAPELDAAAGSERPSPRERLRLEAAGPR